MFEPIEVVPDSPLEKAKILLSTVLKDKNCCRRLETLREDPCKHEFIFCEHVFRDYAFKLKPLKLSQTLINQLLALEKCFSEKAIFYIYILAVHDLLPHK